MQQLSISTNVMTDSQLTGSKVTGVAASAHRVSNAEGSREEFSTTLTQVQQDNLANTSSPVSPRLTAVATEGAANHSSDSPPLSDPTTPELVEEPSSEQSDGSIFAQLSMATGVEPAPEAKNIPQTNQTDAIDSNTTKPEALEAVSTSAVATDSVTKNNMFAEPPAASGNKLPGEVPSATASTSSDANKSPKQTQAHGQDDGVNDGNKQQTASAEAKGSNKAEVMAARADKANVQPMEAASKSTLNSDPKASPESKTLEKANDKGATTHTTATTNSTVNVRTKARAAGQDSMVKGALPKSEALLTAGNKFTALLEKGAFEQAAADDFPQNFLQQNLSQQGIAAKNEITMMSLAPRQGEGVMSSPQEMIQRFSPLMKQQLLTMVSQGVQHASIRLDPAELGSLVIKLQVQGDQTQVQFQAAQPHTRDLVEQSMPRLKDLLSEQGLDLTDTSVSDQQQQSQNSDHDPKHDSNHDSEQEQPQSGFYDDGRIIADTQTDTISGAREIKAERERLEAASQWVNSVALATELAGEIQGSISGGIDYYA